MDKKQNILQKVKPYLLILGIALVISLPLALTNTLKQKNVAYLPTKASTEQLPPSTFITQQKASQESTVQNKIVAQKLDLQRKIIQPKNTQQITAIKEIIEKQGGSVKKTKNDMIVAYIPKETEEEIQQSLQDTDSIKSLEVDYPTFLAAENPDWGIQRIEAPGVWETTSAEGIRIGIVDTGVDYTHPDLSTRFVGGIDNVNEDTDPFDDNGHGTHVAGIIASEINNVGIIGAAPKANILALKALGSDGTGYISDLVEAVDWAIQNNIQILNFSLGTTYNSSLLASKLNQASDQGIILVAAAGNTNQGALLYPAAYDNVISVAASDNNDQFASFSSIGAEITAPGVSITSTIPGGGYASWSGTSMAAPHVTATTALMLANKQTNIRSQLHETALDLGPTGVDSYFGYGLVHTKPATLGNDVLAPVITFISPDNNQEVNEEAYIELEIQDENNIAKAYLFINNQLVTQWTQEPYTFTWDTSKVESGLYEIMAEATDEFNNTAQVRVTIEKMQASTPIPTASTRPSTTPTSSPSAEPTTIPTPEPINTPTPSPLKHDWQRGQSEEKRKDINNETPEKQRQNYIHQPTHIPQPIERKNQNKNENEESSIPEVTNIHQRNPIPTRYKDSYNQKETTSNNEQNENTGERVSEKTREKSKGKVKGETTIPWWLHIFF